MRQDLRLTDGAEPDLDRAFAWCELQKEGLGVRFLDRAAELWTRLEEEPHQFAEILPGVRRGLMRRFPYGAYYSVESQRIVVRAVLHLHRSPEAWRKRLPPRDD